MNFRIPLLNKSTSIFIIVAGVLTLVYVILRLVFFDSDPLIPILDDIYKKYLLLPEGIANLIFESANAKVHIQDHQLVFENISIYHINYKTYLENWPKYLLYKRFSILILVLIWSVVSPLRKKILFMLIFLVTHIISVVGGLYLIGFLCPAVIDDQTSYFVSPTLAGSLACFILLLFWVMFNKQEIRDTLKKFGININISDKRTNEILILLFFFLILRNYIIPFIAFKQYVVFLLEITRRLALFFNYSSYIGGDQLIGENGALALSKHCLGFMTMYLFAAMVYLTRLSDMKREVWIYISSGIIFLFILNLVRLLAVFIVAQGVNGFQRANRHHEIYNIVIYIVVFILWVVWLEFFVWKGKRKRRQIMNTES